MSTQRDPYAAMDAGLRNSASREPSRDACRWAAGVLLAGAALAVTRALLLAVFSYSRFHGAALAFGIILGVLDVACAVMLWRGSQAGRMVTLFRAVAALIVGSGVIVFADAMLIDRAFSLVMYASQSVALLLLLLNAPGRWRIVVALALFLAGFALPTMIHTGINLLEPTWGDESLQEYEDSEFPIATPMPGSTRRRGGIEYGRFEHCDADGCLALDMPVEGAEDSDVCLWSLGDDGYAWVMSATLYALEDESDPHLIPDALELCIDWWIDGGEFDTYEIVDSDVGERRGTYRLDTHGEYGEGLGLAYFEADGAQLIEVCIHGPADSTDVQAIFDRAVDTVEITGAPEPWEEEYATPVPGSAIRKGDITYGLFEHCDMDGCFQIEMPVDLTSEDEDSIYSGDDDWVMSAIIITNDGTPGDPDPSLETVVDWAVEGWFESEAVDRVRDETYDQGEGWISYQAECVYADGDTGDCFVWAKLDDGRIKVLWAVDYEPDADVAAMFKHARETFVITE